MAEYIDRMAAKKAIKDKPDMTNDEKASLFRRINAIPAADVVEVVRCKDCINYEPLCGLCLLWNRCGVDVHPEGYCYHGVKHVNE